MVHHQYKVMHFQSPNLFTDTVHYFSIVVSTSTMFGSMAEQAQVMKFCGLACASLIEDCTVLELHLIVLAMY